MNESFFKTFFVSPTFWFALSFICLIIEINTFDFMFGTFAVSAVATAIASFFTQNIYILLGIFSATSLLTFAFLRPWYLNQIVKNSENRKFGFQSLMGKTANVIEAIAPDKPGYVKVDGDEWKAESEQQIQTGEQAEIIGLEGNTVKVKKVD